MFSQSTVTGEQLSFSLGQGFTETEMSGPAKICVAGSVLSAVYLSAQTYRTGESAVASAYCAILSGVRSATIVAVRGALGPFFAIDKTSSAFAVGVHGVPSAEVLASTSCGFNRALLFVPCISQSLKVRCLSPENSAITANWRLSALFLPGSAISTLKPALENDWLAPVAVQLSVPMSDAISFEPCITAVPSSPKIPPLYFAFESEPVSGAAASAARAGPGRCAAEPSASEMTEKTAIPVRAPRLRGRKMFLVTWVLLLNSHIRCLTVHIARTLGRVTANLKLAWTYSLLHCRKLIQLFSNT